MTEDDKPPVCPGCNQPAEPGTYPPGTKGWYWCNKCLLRKIKDARNEV